MRKRKIEDQEFLQAATLWKIERKIPDRKGRYARTIVGQVNKQLGTSVQKQKVRRRVNAELNKDPPCLRCICKSSDTSGIECAIASGIKIFINLANAGMKIKANRQTLIARVEACLTQGVIHFRRFNH